MRWTHGSGTTTGEAMVRPHFRSKWLSTDVQIYSLNIGNIDYGNLYPESENVIRSAEDRIQRKLELDNAFESSRGTACGNDADPVQRIEQGEKELETTIQQRAAAPNINSFAIAENGKRIDHATRKADAERRAFLFQRHMKQVLLEKIEKRKADNIARKEMLCLQLMTKKIEEIKTLKTCEALAKQIKFSEEEEYGTAGGSSSNSESASNAIATSRNSPASSRACRKRCRTSDHGPVSEGEDNPTRSSRSNSGNRQSSDGGLKLACPFRKQDPLKYNLHDYPICALSSWSTIARVK